MSTGATEAKTNGLTTVRDMIIAPASAFAAIERRPTWVAALLVTIVCSVIAGILIEPALVHMFQVWYPTQMTGPQFDSLTPEQRARTMSFGLTFARFGWIVTAAVSGIFAALATAVVLFIVARAAGGAASFPRMFSLAMNVAIINFGLSQLVTAVIVLLRGPDAFSSPQDFALAVPDLAWLAPGAVPKVAAFLAAFNPFSIWSLLLLGAGTASVGRVSPPIAYAAAFLLVLCTAAVAATGAR
jgi:Yip1-like protein